MFFFNGNTVKAMRVDTIEFIDTFRKKSVFTDIFEIILQDSNFSTNSSHSLMVRRNRLIFFPNYFYFLTFILLSAGPCFLAAALEAPRGLFSTLFTLCGQ